VVRTCRRNIKWLLAYWFIRVEARVWEFVTAHYGRLRPKRIFLVTGQTMTSEYSISHQEQRSVDCEVYIEGEAGIPSLIEGRAYWGYEIGRVSASRGFEISARRSLRDGTEQLHSIFFNTELPSAPLNRFKKLIPNSSRLRKVQRMYK
jgi:hypothetical protein